ncbi:hypothetical protein [Streptomyces sp. NPDC048521]|uniref:SCO2400 family protein n=1 Tax=Streptomyces sp. NPDC048521 TaxID=3365566 RepID=UPI00371FEBEB
MDYCSSCRRHLNGALVCPGCGAYAPDIAPPGTGGPGGSLRAAGSAGTGGMPAATTVRTPDALVGIWHDGSTGDAAEPGGGAGASSAGPADEAEGVPPAPRGRAARRRQLARWKKSRRRAAVATAFAIVGGGLTIATMDRNSADRAQAATAPDHRSMDVAEEQPAEPTGAVPTPSTPHRPAHTTAPTAQSPATHVPRQRSLPDTPRTAPVTRPDTTAVQSRQVSAGASQPRTTVPPAADTAPDHTGTAPAPAPATGDGGTNSGTNEGTNGGTNGGTGSGTSGTAPAPESSSPAQLCLVLVCLG